MSPVAETYHAEIDPLPEGAPCECGGCGWTGPVEDLRPVMEAMLTPGDPSPAGRCPICDALAYPAKPRGEDPCKG